MTRRCFPIPGRRAITVFFVCHIERTPWSGSLNRTQHALFTILLCSSGDLSDSEKHVAIGGACVHGELQRCCGRVLQGNIFLNIASHKRLSTGRGPGWGSGGGVSNEEFRSSGGHSKQLPSCWGSIQPTKNGVRLSRRLCFGTLQDERPCGNVSQDWAIYADADGARVVAWVLDRCGCGFQGFKTSFPADASRIVLPGSGSRG